MTPPICRQFLSTPKLAASAGVECLLNQSAPIARSHASRVLTVPRFLRDVPTLRDDAKIAGVRSCSCCEQRAIVPSLNCIAKIFELTDRDECFPCAVWNGQGTPVMAVKLIEALFADNVDGDLSLGHEYKILNGGRARLSKRLAGSGVAINHFGLQRSYMIALTGDHASIGEAEWVADIIARIPEYAKRKGLTEHSRRVTKDFLRSEGTRDQLTGNGFAVAHSAGPLPPIDRSIA